MTRLSWPTLNTTPVTPHPEAVIRADGGRCGVLVVRRLGVRLTGHTRSWVHPSLCGCTDCGRNQPLRDCAECGGVGDFL